MASQATRLIADGHRDLVVQGLRQVEQEMAAQGDTRQFLPQKDNASLTDQEVTDAFAEVGKSYLVERDTRRPSTVKDAGQSSALAPVMNAVTRVMNEGLKKDPQGKGNSSVFPQGRGEASRFTQETLQAQRRPSTGQPSHADASFGNTPGTPSPSSERSQEERRAERAKLDAGIPKGRDWISRMFKLNPQSALHEIARKAATLVDIAFDIDYDRPRFDKLGKFKELLFTDAANPNPDNLYTDDYGRYEEPGSGPAQFHTSKDSPHPLMSSLHEIGYHLAKMLGASAENDMANAHRGDKAPSIDRGQSVQRARFCDPRSWNAAGSTRDSLRRSWRK
jgi:hypothetical protein